MRLTVTASDEVKAHVHAGQRAGRCHETPFIDEEHVRIEQHLGKATCERLRGHPVGRRAPTIEKTGRRQGERPRADRYKPRAVRPGRVKGGEEPAPAHPTPDRRRQG